MEELRLAFLVLGACAIAGILVHGLWSVRKNTKSEKQSYEPRDWQEDADDAVIEAGDGQEITIDVDDPLLNVDDNKFAQYDDLGLGEVRVISRAENTPASPLETAPQQEPQGDFSQADVSESSDVQTTEAQSATDQAETPTETNAAEEFKSQVATPKTRIYSSVVTQPKPEYAEQQAVQIAGARTNRTSVDEIPEPPPSLLKKSAPAQTETPSALPTKDAPSHGQQTPEPEIVATEEKFSLAEQARKLVSRKKAEAKPRKRREPRVREDQMSIDFDEPQTNASVPEKDEVKAAAKPASEMQQEVLVLNVKADDNAPIQGAALLPMLLTLGFKFGDQDIFHRHVNSNGKGPVLFSLANMFKPGVFDIDNLENFTTQGISLFMILPIEGDPHQVFNMMHNAARKIADEFNAQVLDGRRSVLTKQSLQQYVEKIREFERQRMIAR